MPAQSGSRRVSRTRPRALPDRRLQAAFRSPRLAVEALTTLRREIPEVSVQLRPLGQPGDGAEPEDVAIDARIPWRWCRAVVLLVVGLDASAQLAWDEPAGEAPAA